MKAALCRLVIRYDTTVWSRQCSPAEQRPRRTASSGNPRIYSARKRTENHQFASMCASEIANSRRFTIGQAVAVTDTRHARYRGLPKIHLQHVASAAALNLIRLDAWPTPICCLLVALAGSIDQRTA